MSDLSPTSGIAQAFSSAEKTYAQHAFLQREVAQWLAKKLNCNDTRRVILDIGCGTGFVAQCSPLYEFIGLDIASGLLKQCTAHPNIHNTVLADMHALPFANNRIEGACANLALQWSNNPTRVLNEVLRVLKPNGHFIFTVPLRHSLKEIKYCWQASNSEPPINPLFSLEQWGGWVAQSGLSVTSQMQKTLTHYYPNAREAFLSLKRTGAYYKHNTHRTSIHPSAMQERIKAYNDLKQPQGFPLSFNVGLICAQKGDTQ